MSFTQDELQSFHTVLEQRLQAHQREIEHAFDERLSEYRRDNEHRLYAMQHELLRAISFKLTEFQGQVEGLLSQQAQQLALASLDQLNEEALANGHQQLEAIEVQTELPWEDLAAVIGQTLDERLNSIKEETRRLLSQQEHQFAQQLHGLRNELAQLIAQAASNSEQSEGGPALSDLLQGIEHLERVIESLQVVMTANHALLSDRLYSHQQQPVERAHPAGHLRAHLPAEQIRTEDRLTESSIAGS
ncbi:MAG TPA: hypothetical protein VGT44_14400 [Ktedonobacteraceae bacterium]|nr:hypothetical protein [Ktedonobacteraceae bacterium]